MQSFMIEKLRVSGARKLDEEKVTVVAHHRT